ncbi:MAG: hypothetical protein M3413_07190 [Bacteroidota bacterium]|jgi:hypothetical protein|nr:hypothetical protein [Bacteroidota bacterium]
MKQTFTLLVFVLAVSFVSAQSSPRTQNAKAKTNTNTKTSTTEHQAKADVKDKEVVVKMDDVVTNQNTTASPGVVNTGYNAIIFKNGQSATQSGHEALAMASGYSFFKKAVTSRLTTDLNAVGDVNSGSFSRDNAGFFMKNGQTASSTGHEATAVNGGYASFSRKNLGYYTLPGNNDGEAVTEKAPADNTTIYKKNGQAATKTGHEATAVGGGYSSLKKN